LRAGAEAGAIYGLVNMTLGGYVVDPIQAIFDYPIAFAALGLAGIFMKYPLLGVSLGIFGRFITHFTTGVLWWGPLYAPKEMNYIVYSAIYNIPYLAAEFVVSLLVIYILNKRRLIKVAL
jgi:thiamine transporter